MFRIVWRDGDRDREPEVLEFNRVVFGKDAAPIECQFVAQKNARRNQSTYPMAADRVLKSTHMDDLIDSVESEEEGIELYRHVDALWNLIGRHASSKMDLKLSQSCFCNPRRRSCNSIKLE